MPLRRRMARKVVKNSKRFSQKMRIKKNLVDLNHIRQFFDKLQELKATISNAKKQEFNKFVVEFMQNRINSENISLSSDNICITQLFAHKSLTTFEVQTSKDLDIFMVRENEICTARSIYSEMWDKELWNNIDTIQKQYELKRKIIKDVLVVMSDLDLYILKTILQKNSDSLVGLEEVIDNRKKLIYYLMVYMNIEYETIDLMTEILQLWYLVQPAVVESCKYTGGIITEELDAILIDVDALYDWIKTNKKDCADTESMLCSVQEHT